MKSACFFAGDAAILLKAEVTESVRGVGTGALSEHLEKLIGAGVSIFVSAMSSKARGVTEGDLAGKNAVFAVPAKLVDLTFNADRVLCY